MWCVLVHPATHLAIPLPGQSVASSLIFHSDQLAQNPGQVGTEKYHLILHKRKTERTSWIEWTRPEFVLVKKKCSLLRFFSRFFFKKKNAFFYFQKPSFCQQFPDSTCLQLLRAGYLLIFLLWSVSLVYIDLAVYHSWVTHGPMCTHPLSTVHVDLRYMWFVSISCFSHLPVACEAHIDFPADLPFLPCLGVSHINQLLCTRTVSRLSLPKCWCNLKLFSSIFTAPITRASSLVQPILATFSFPVLYCLFSSLFHLSAIIQECNTISLNRPVQ